MNNSDLEKYIQENRRLQITIAKQGVELKEKDIHIHNLCMTISETEYEYIEILKGWEDKETKTKNDELIKNVMINTYNSVISILRKNK